MADRPDKRLWLNTVDSTLIAYIDKVIQYEATIDEYHEDSGLESLRKKSAAHCVIYEFDHVLQHIEVLAEQNEDLFTLRENDSNTHYKLFGTSSRGNPHKLRIDNPKNLYLFKVVCGLDLRSKALEFWTKKVAEATGKKVRSP